MPPVSQEIQGRRKDLGEKGKMKYCSTFYLFLDPKTIATLVNYSHKSFIKLTPGQR